MTESSPLELQVSSILSSSCVQPADLEVLAWLQQVMQIA
jgi:hypothetical protein